MDLPVPGGQFRNFQLKDPVMNKLLATLVASLFVASTAFAASHVGAPMAGASAPMAAPKMDSTEKQPVKHVKKHKKHKVKKAHKAAATDKK
jgi:hypothetical protein